MRYLKLSLDFSDIDSVNKLYSKLSDLFGFPDFFGKNVNALIDCLSSLRYPDDEMTKINLAANEILLLDVKNTSSAKQDVKDTLLFAIEYSNLKSQEKGDGPLIYLYLNR